MQKHIHCDEWISKAWRVHAMEYYSPLRRRAILRHVTTWMNPEDIQLSEMKWSQKDKYCMIPPMHLEGQNQRQKKWDGGCQRLLGGVGNEELLING